MSAPSGSGSGEASGPPNSPAPAPHWARVLIAVLLLAPMVLAVDSLRQKSWTWDEPIYLAGGHYLTYTGNFRIKPLSYHPPLAFYVNSLGLLPIDLPQRFFPASVGDYVRDVGLRVAFESEPDPKRVRLLARLPFVLLSPMLGALAYLWSRELWGWRGGLLSLWLVAWSPNLLAHTRLVTTDMLFTVACVATLWSARMLFARGGTWRLLRTGLFAGLTCLAKFSAVILLPLAALGAWFSARGAVGTGWRAWPISRVVAGLSVVVLVAGLCIWAGYFGQFGPALVDAGERETVRAMAPPEGWVDRAMYHVYRSDLPLPAVSYVMGFFSQYAHGSGGHSNYLLGEVSGSGWWYYFLVALLVKTPVPVLGLWGIGMVAAWRSAAPRREIVWILAAPVVLMLLSMGSNIAIGVRHVLLVYPLAAIVAGAAVRYMRPTLGRAVGVACCVWLLAATLWIHPHYLTYFNVAAGGPARGHCILVDSNLDWGQDFDALIARAEAEGWLPLQVQYFGPPHRLDYAPPNIRPLEGPCEPTSGYAAVSVTNRVGAYMPNGAACFAWLDAHEPIARVHHTIWVYRIPETTVSHGSP